VIGVYEFENLKVNPFLTDTALFPETCMTAALQALIFDVDGTLADTESAHLAAFNHAFAELGLAWVGARRCTPSCWRFLAAKSASVHYWKRRQPDMRALDAMAHAGHDQPTPRTQDRPL
jgi:phosphoglycolate phosphatase-like HAD superfamily hydrolase